MSHGVEGHARPAQIDGELARVAAERMQVLAAPSRVQQIGHLWPLAAAGVVGFAGNEIAARIRMRAGRRLDSPAMIADGAHAGIDGFVSLSVVASAILVAVGLNIGDPIVGLLMTLVILRITWQSFRTVQRDPGTELDVGDHVGQA